MFRFICSFWRSALALGAIVIFASSTSAATIPPNTAADSHSAAVTSCSMETDLIELRDRLMKNIGDDRDYMSIMLDMGLSWMRQTGDGAITGALDELRMCHDAKAVADLIVHAKAVAATDKKKASWLWQTAGLLTTLNDVARSGEFYRLAVELTPDDADALYGVALAQAASGQLDEAMENIRQVLSKTKGEPAVFFQYWARLRLIRLEIRNDEIGGLPEEFDALKSKIEAMAATKASYLPWERDLAVALVDLGNALFLKTDFDSALETYRAALAIEEKLLASKPDDAQWQSDVVVADERIANALFKTGDRVGALATLEDAMTVIRGAGVPLLSVPAWRDARGTVNESIGNLLILERRYEEARGHLADAVADAEWLGRETENRRDWPSDLARREETLATLLKGKLGDESGAIVWYGKLCSIRSWLKRDAPKDRLRGFDLARAYRGLASAHVVAGHGPEALDAYGNAIRVGNDLVAADAKDRRAQNDLATTFETLGNAQHALGNEEASALAFARSKSIRNSVVAGSDLSATPRQTAVR